MRILDPEYQELIKMRFILRTEEVEDKDILILKLKQLVMNSKDIQAIADDIGEIKNKGGFVSKSSVGRWFGIYQASSNISRTNLDTIARYLMCSCWDELISLDHKEVEQRILHEHSMAEAEQLVSMDSRGDDISFGIQRVVSHNIPAGKVLEIRYGKRNKVLKIKKLNSDDRYLVLECGSAVLEKGYSISIPAVLLGVNVVGIDIQYQGQAVKSIYKSSGTVNSIKFVELL